MFVQLSDPLSFCSNFTGRKKLVRWASCIASFAERTISLLNQTSPLLQKIAVPKALLDVSSYFFKIVRTEAKSYAYPDTNTDCSTARTNLNNIYDVYERLSRAEEGEQTPILYPQGVVEYPDSSIPSSREIHIALTAQLKADGFLMWRPTAR